MNISMDELTLYRKDPGQKKPFKSTEPSEIFPNWKGEKESWVIVAPHDDDAVIGGGLLWQKAMEANIDLHLLITTDGQMGYCKPEDKDTIQDTRHQETIKSCKILEMDKLHWLNFPDCSLHLWGGRKKAKDGDPCSIVKYTGLQNAYTFYFRKWKPTRVFLPTGNDLHPDHKVVYQETLISIFHAAGDIWPELGQPTESVPNVYEMAIYCDFPEEPNLKIVGSEEHLNKKLEAIKAYESQKQIEQLVENVRKGGPVEYFRDVKFNLYSPDKYKQSF